MIDPRTGQFAEIACLDPGDLRQATAEDHAAAAELAARHLPPDSLAVSAWKATHARVEAERWARENPGPTPADVEDRVRRENAAAMAEAMRPAAAITPPRPTPAAPERVASRFAEYGAAGAEVRRGQRQAAVATAQETAAGLAWTRLRQGMPRDDPAPAWSLDRMAYWTRDAWPKPQPMPAVRTLSSHLRGAIRRGLLPPVAEWPLEASTVPAVQPKP